MDQLPNSIVTIPNYNEVDITIEDVNEMLFELEDSTSTKQDFTNVPIVLDHDCSNNLCSDSNRIRPQVSELSMSILANVHLVKKLIEEMKIPVCYSATRVEEYETQTRDWVPEGPLLKGPLPQEATSDTNMKRIHKKLRILKEARQRRKW